MATSNDFQIPTTGIFGARRVPLARAASVVDVAAGFVVLGLAILGLAGVAPRTMVALCCSAGGIAVALEGAGVVRRYLRMTSFHGRPAQPQIQAAIVAEVVGGIIGLSLGILALAGFERLAFPAIASIVFGAALLVGTGVEIEIDSAKISLEPTESRRVIHEAVVAAGGARLLVAVAAATLGVLALAGVATLALILTASLLLGVGLMLGTVSVGDRVTAREYFEDPAT